MDFLFAGFLKRHFALMFTAILKLPNIVRFRLRENGQKACGHLVPDVALQTAPLTSLIAPPSTVLQCSALHCTELYYSALNWTVLCCAGLKCISVHILYKQGFALQTAYKLNCAVFHWNVLMLQLDINGTDQPRNRWVNIWTYLNRLWKRPR